MTRLLLLLTLMICSECSAQNSSNEFTISGKLSQLANQEIKLEGFKGLHTYTISKTTIAENGDFMLSYSKADYGMGYLKSADEKAFIVILSGEAIKISGEALANTQSIIMEEGQENQWFGQYAKEQPRREQALSAWGYLEKIYTLDSLFSVQEVPMQAIHQEKQRIKDEDLVFLNSLPKDSYARWFLPVRKMVSSVSAIAQYRTEEIPATIAAFRDMDFTDNRLYKSGLYKDALESHFWLLENSGIPLDSVYIEMGRSIDAMMEHLVRDERKLNEATDFLFDLMERRSLFTASEYLALKVLNETSCTIDGDLAKQLETYRAMKKGNIAPDIVFDGDIWAPAHTTGNAPHKLSDMGSNYTLVVFGASWCPKCTEELPEIAKRYDKWKAKGVEVVFVSLDDDVDTYQNFVRPFPFLSTCDFQKWDGKAVQDYYVFGTPTMFLLDDQREILLRPISVAQVDKWVEYKL